MQKNCLNYKSVYVFKDMINISLSYEESSAVTSSPLLICATHWDERMAIHYPTRIDEKFPFKEENRCTGLIFLACVSRSLINIAFLISLHFWF